MASLSAAELFRLALATRREDYRAQLVRAYMDDEEGALSEIGRRVGGETVPDTIIVRTGVEVVLAALAYIHAERVARRLRIVAPSEPHEGWGPLNELLEYLAVKGRADVYRVPMTPTHRLHVRDAARKLGRVLRGFSARVVDVTDAPAFTAPGVYAAGVRVLTVLVETSYGAIFQKLNFTLQL